MKRDLTNSRASGLLGLFAAILVERLAFHGIQPWGASLSLFMLALSLWPTRLSSLPQNDNYPLNVPVWSFVYEIFANLLYAMLVWFRLARMAVLLCIVAASLALLSNAGRPRQCLGRRTHLANLGLGFACVFSFFLGVLICRLYRHRSKNAANA
jgi:peptidoglycan/LPS O-acetylase OafA/YrhL